MKKRPLAARSRRGARAAGPWPLLARQRLDVPVVARSAQQAREVDDAIRLPYQPDRRTLRLDAVDDDAALRQVERYAVEVGAGNAPQWIGLAR